MKKKVLLLVPISVAAGGIHSWAKLLLQEQTGAIEYIIADTSVHYRTLGGKMGIKEALCAVWDCVLRFSTMIRHFIQDRPEIVYFTCSPSIGFAFRDTPLIALSKLFGRKVVIHLHGGSTEGFWGGNFLKKSMAGLGSKFSDYIFTITRECETFARDRFNPNKVIYVPNFIKTDCLDGLVNQIPPEIKTNRFNVIHIAFQCEAKGTFQIIEAAKYLKNDVNILLIGPVAKENRIAIDEAIKKENVQDKVFLVGPVTKPQLWHYYRNADLFLFPTHTEGFPNVIMEAMLCRLPIVSTDVGNIVEMVDAEGEKPAALILKHSDPPQAKEIAELIHKLKEDKPLRERLGEYGYSRVIKTYSTDVVIPSLERILHAIDNKENVAKISNECFAQKG